MRPIFFVTKIFECIGKKSTALRGILGSDSHRVVPSLSYAENPIKKGQKLAEIHVFSMFSFSKCLTRAGQQSHNNHINTIKSKDKKKGLEGGTIIYYINTI